MKKVVALVLSLFLVGCAGKNMAIDRATLPTLKGKSVTLVKNESPNFVAMTSGKGMFAVAGVGAAIAAGNQLVRDNQIADPAPNISRMLAQELNSRYGLSPIGDADKVAESTGVADIAKLANGSDYALDVATNGWSFMYDGFNFSDYMVGCSVKMRLIEVANSRVISEGVCAYDTKRAGKPLVRYEQLLEDNAAYIKQSLEDATLFCVDKFKTELF